MQTPGRTKIVSLLTSTAQNIPVTVKGWVRTKRGNKNVAFIALNDGSCIHNIQLVVNPNDFNEELSLRAMKATFLFTRFVRTHPLTVTGMF
jgi:asparaginyl-tRNA synthetase